MKIQITFALLLIFSLSALKTVAGENEQTIARNNYLKYFQTIPTGTADKVAAVEQFRNYFSKKPYRLHSMKISLNSWRACYEQLNDDGLFKDLVKKEENIISKNLLGKSFGNTNNEVAEFFTEAYNRIWTIANAYRKGEADEKTMFSSNVLKAIVHYGNIETSRPNIAGRFHSSCFAMPTAAVNIYFAMLPKMDEVESGKTNDKLLTEAADMLKIIALQAWTQPFRNDETDANVVQIDRFRNHAWWVGGNALAFRSLLPVAFMYKSVPMVDLLADVSQKALSTTSQNTIETSFWTEGFTTDGAGWGHGRQCLIWGYPFTGASNALSVLSILKGSPWVKELSEENKNALMNFLRGSNWYYYKGFTLPGLDRHSMRYAPAPKAIPTQALARTILKDWKESFSAAQQAEITQFVLEANNNNINMSNYPNGTYSGTRWFFNNDDLIKKNERYHIIINMASVRCDGLESAPHMADAYNFFTKDGMTLYQKTGDEYSRIIGAWDITASPGVTAREGMERIKPVTNWRGYCSKHNFAGAATYGGENAAAGFIFEKMNASEKENVNDRGGLKIDNASIYDVKAYKSWFMLGDYTIALGAGITNLNPEMEGEIRTTIDQTAYEGKITVTSKGKVLKLKEGEQSFVHRGKPVWVQHDNKFAYTVLPEFSSSASFIIENKKTEWVKMNRSNQNIANLPTEANILRLWINHGQKPVNATYGYVVYAGNEKLPAKLPFTVLKNDTTLQAIQSSDLKMVGAVFYKPGSINGHGDNLTVSDPCVLLIESNDENYTIAIQDPTMNNNLKHITLSINDQKFAIELPQGEFAGKPAILKISK